MNDRVNYNNLIVNEQENDDGGGYEISGVSDTVEIANISDKSLKEIALRKREWSRR